MKPFNCSKCGKCCIDVDANELTKFLDRGDGVCKNLNEETKGCRAYEIRPMFCRVDECYLSMYRSVCTWEEFTELTKAVCKKL